MAAQAIGISDGNRRMSESGELQRIFLGIDVGGTNIKSGIVDDEGRVLAKSSVPTEASLGPDHGVQQMTLAAQQAVKQLSLTMDDIAAVGLATPGTMDIPAGMLLNPPNLAGWTDYPVQQRVADALGVPQSCRTTPMPQPTENTGLARPATQTVLSFLLWGPDSAAASLSMTPLFRVSIRMARNWAHIIIEMDNGRLCNTGQYGTLEAYCSATSLIQRFHEAIQADEHRLCPIEWTMRRHCPRCCWQRS